MKKSKIALLMAVIMCATMLLTACAPAEPSKPQEPTSPTTPTTPTAPTTPPAENKKPQEINVAISTTFSTLDTAVISTTHMAHVNNNTGSFLFRTQADGVSEKELCKDYTVSEDGLTYTFTIVDNVKWSDGVPLTADHFVYALKRAIGYGPSNGYAVKNLTGFIKGAKEAWEAQMNVADMKDVGVTKIDEHTFKIELASPCPYFLKLFGGGATSPLREDYAKEHESTWSLTAGYPSLGAMTLQSINPNESAVFVKNPNYIHADKVTVDKITYIVMPDMSAQLNAFKAGQIDVALSVPADTASNSQYAPSFFKADSYTSNYFVSVNAGPKNTVPALLKPNVRKALAMAVDKKTMLTVLNSGPYVTELNGYVPFGFPGEKGDFRSEADYLTFNLEQAKKLMEAEGFSEANPLQFEYLYSNAQFHADVAQLLQQMWAKIHVKLDLKAVEGGVFYDFVDEGNFTTARYAIADSTDPLNYFKTFTTNAQFPGCEAIADSKFDALVSEAYTITDPAAYAKKLHEIEAYMVGEMGYVIPLFTQIPVILVQENIKGMWATPGGTLCFSSMTVN